MPIYPYLCSACDHEFDTLQKISDEALKICPQCGEASLRKKLTAAAFHLKGTGWYQTDFKDKGAKPDDKDKDKKTDDKTQTKVGKEDKKSDDKGGGKSADSSAGSGKDKSSSPKSESSKADSV